MVNDKSFYVNEKYEQNKKNVVIWKKFGIKI